MASRPTTCNASILILIVVAATQLHSVQKSPSSIRVPVRATLDSLLADEDTDGDKKITIDDPHVSGSTRGDKRFWIRSTEGRSVEISGTYRLATLLALLKRAEDNRADTIALTPQTVFLEPVENIAHSIKEFYWNGLTRRIDAAGLEAMFTDDKTHTMDGHRYVYVPLRDTLATKYYSNIAREHPSFKMTLIQLPAVLTPAYARSLEGKHGVLTLGLRGRIGGPITGVPFVVPGGRFNEMYGWDSYFIVQGLLECRKTNLARSIVDNFVYEIEYYGKILNANRTYYLTRSQPPFLTSMAYAVYRRLPKTAASKRWLARALEAAIREYRGVWIDSAHVTPTGLSRYFDTGTGPPPEVEPGRYTELFTRTAQLHNADPAKFESEYSAGILNVPELDKFFADDRSMRESGHDASYRLQYDCAELATVDLNSLLFKTESDLAQIISREFHRALPLRDGTVERSDSWRTRARSRMTLMMKYLWNDKQGMFFDYNFVENKQTTFVSATTLYPLWAHLVTPRQAGRLIRAALPLLAMPGGIVGSTEESRGPITVTHPQTQWDYPFGWAPHQMLVWNGLVRYGYGALARHLAYRWLYTVTVNARNFNGTIAEKYDVVTRSSQVFAEYGNVGTTFSYLTREGFGWTNASYVVGLRLLPQNDIEELNRLIPPEWIFPPLSADIRKTD